MQFFSCGEEEGGAKRAASLAIVPNPHVQLPIMSQRTLCASDFGFKEARDRAELFSREMGSTGLNQLNIHPIM